MQDGDLGLRIGDDERAAVDARLQLAVGRGQLTLVEYEERSGEVWRARTRAELDTTTRDLPAVPAAAPVDAPVRGWRPRRVLAVMSGDALSGPVQPGQDVQAYAVMGGAVVDLRRDDLPPVVRVRAVAVMGGVEVLVPRGVTVHLSGASLMGGRQAAVDPPRPGGPVVEVQGYAVMGGVDVKHGGPAPTGGSVRLDRASEPVAAPAVTPDAHRAHRGRRAGRRGLALTVVGVVALGVGLPAVARADDTAVFGSREVHVRAGDVKDVGVMFGSVKVVVDDGAGVELSGGMVFGSSQCKECSARDAALTPVQVHGRGAFGSIEVVRAGGSDDG